MPHEQLTPTDRGGRAWRWSSQQQCLTSATGVAGKAWSRWRQCQERCLLLHSPPHCLGPLAQLATPGADLLSLLWGCLGDLHAARCIWCSTAAGKTQQPAEECASALPEQAPTSCSSCKATSGEPWQHVVVTCALPGQQVGRLLQRHEASCCGSCQPHLTRASLAGEERLGTCQLTGCPQTLHATICHSETPATRTVRAAPPSQRSC